jgi:hypothetical protein
MRGADVDDVRTRMEEASAFHRRKQPLTAPRGPHPHEPAADHAAHETQAARHEAWYVSQDVAPGRETDRMAAEIAAAGRPTVDERTLLAEITRERADKARAASKGPSEVGSMPPFGAAMLRRESHQR